ncbi:MAG: Bro-N domain-containing protein [Nanoarchaeota archaeon]|nr:Bro-N domain-containing protein [Nanoarchaeota archaeon]MBU4352108.1 Bro-N domain-containing protein [Nanoarchaeota archaeon]
MEIKNKLIVFQGKNIRRTWHNDEWWFSVIDIVAVLTESQDGRKYWNKLSQRLREEGSEVVTNCHRLKLQAEDSKMRETDCANTEVAFRIIQSIPSKKAEPMKLWLAKVGYERVQEIENPELAMDRAKEYYKLKGYSKEWIEKRLRSIAIRKELTDEWSNRGIEEKREFAILTDEINKATFDVSIKEHKQIKNLNPKFKNQNLRDHMTDLELIFNMLGEKVTTEITKKDDAKGFDKCKNAAKRGGKVARNARIETEKEIGRKVVSKDNAKQLTKKESKRLE